MTALQPSDKVRFKDASEAEQALVQPVRLGADHTWAERVAERAAAVDRDGDQSVVQDRPVSDVADHILRQPIPAVRRKPGRHARPH
jgi:hypothetical protein